MCEPCLCGATDCKRCFPLSHDRTHSCASCGDECDCEGEDGCETCAGCKEEDILCDLCKEEAATGIFPEPDGHKLEICPTCIEQNFIEQCLPDEEMELIPSWAVRRSWRATFAAAREEN